MLQLGVVKEKKISNVKNFTHNADVVFTETIVLFCDRCKDNFSSVVVIVYDKKQVQYVCSQVQVFIRDFSGGMYLYRAGVG